MRLMSWFFVDLFQVQSSTTPRDAAAYRSPSTHDSDRSARPILIVCVNDPAAMMKPQLSCELSLVCWSGLMSLSFIRTDVSDGDDGDQSPDGLLRRLAVVARL